LTGDVGGWTQTCCFCLVTPLSGYVIAWQSCVSLRQGHLPPQPLYYRPGPTTQTIVRRFVPILWCPKGRFVYRTRDGGGVGGTYVGRQHCNRWAVEQNRDWKCRIYMLNHSIN